MKETIFDKILRQMRLRQILPYLSEFKQPRVLDVGCGWEARLLRSIEPFIAKGVGIDFKAPHLRTERLEVFSYIFEVNSPFGETFRPFENFGRETRLDSSECQKFSKGAKALTTSRRLDEQSEVPNARIFLNANDRESQGDSSDSTESSDKVDSHAMQGDSYSTIFTPKLANSQDSRIANGGGGFRC